MVDGVDGSGDFTRQNGLWMMDRRRFLRSSGMLGLGLGAAGVLAACGDSGNASNTASSSASSGNGAPDMDAARKEGLVYWSPTDVTVVTKFLDQFTAKTGIKAVAQDIAPSAALPQLNQAFSAGQVPPVDVFTSSDVGVIENLRAAGHIMQYNSPSFADFPAEYKSNPEGYWCTAYVNVQPPTWRTDMLPDSDTPKSYLDLLDPRFANGKIGLQDTASGTSYAFWYTLKDKLPPTFFDDLAKQKPRGYASTTQMLTDMGNGVIQVAGFMSVIQLVRNYGTIPLAYLIDPEVGTSGNIVVTSIIESAPHPNAAKAFMDYFMSAEGQTAFMEIQGAFPARPDVTLPHVPPLKDFNPIVVTSGFDDYGSDANRKKFTEVWNKVIGVA